MNESLMGLNNLSSDGWGVYCSFNHLFDVYCTLSAARNQCIITGCTEVRIYIKFGLLNILHESEQIN